MNRSAAVIALVSLAIFWAGRSCDADDTNEMLRQRIETIRSNGELEIGASRIAAVRLIPLLYEARGFQPAWTRPTMIAELMEAIAAAPSHGLDDAFEFPTVRSPAFASQ